MSDTQTDLVIVERAPVATITLNRPEAANALSRESVDRLWSAIEELAEDEQVRAIVLTGAGTTAFCAGADLKEREGMDDEDVREFVIAIRDTLTGLANLVVPTIAAINGVAFGGGCELALACDIRVMAAGAQIGLTETALGIIPGGGGTQRLPRLVGRGRAMYMIAQAARIGAAEALASGLVEEVTPPGGAVARARAIGDRIAQNAPLAVQAAKEAIVRGLELEMDEALAIETEMYERMIGTTDRVEGLAAFREKRAPVYRGE